MDGGASGRRGGISRLVVGCDLRGARDDELQGPAGLAVPPQGGSIKDELQPPNAEFTRCGTTFEPVGGDGENPELVSVHVFLLRNFLAQRRT